MNREIRITDKRLRDRKEHTLLFKRKKPLKIKDDKPLRKYIDPKNHRIYKWFLRIIIIIFILAGLAFEPSGLIYFGVIYLIIHLIFKNVDTGDLNGKYLEVGEVYARFKQDRIEFDFAKSTIYFNDIAYIDFAKIYDYRGVQLRFNVHYKDKDKAKDTTDTLYYWNELDIRFDEFVLLFKNAGVQFNPTVDKYIETFLVKRGMVEQYFHAFNIPKHEQERINQLTNERVTHWFTSY